MRNEEIQAITGTVLDIAVAVALDAPHHIERNNDNEVTGVWVEAAWLAQYIPDTDADAGLVQFSPSGDFAQGGALINTIGVDLRQYRTPDYAILDARHFDASKGDVLRTPPNQTRQMVYRPNKKTDFEGSWLAKTPTSCSQVSWSRDRNYTGDTMLVAAMRYIAALQATSHD